MVSRHTPVCSRKKPVCGVHSGSSGLRLIPWMYLTPLLFILATPMLLLLYSSYSHVPASLLQLLPCSCFSTLMFPLQGLCSGHSEWKPLPLAITKYSFLRRPTLDYQSTTFSALSLQPPVNFSKARRGSERKNIPQSVSPLGFPQRRLRSLTGAFLSLRPRITMFSACSDAQQTAEHIDYSIPNDLFQCWVEAALTTGVR